ncbi:MFS transporter [Cohnella sp. WQ 127256]|uniref:MFS transporter n=1 Tax=Cohnella sp. WQ 127256 TaxID=2938790 RepID=UPI0021193D81|nr:MFS transporter [Cohnella sp. WQ 127256]
MVKEKKGLWLYENRLVLMMFVVFGLVFFERLNILYLFPYMAPDLGMNNTQIGLTVGVLGIAWGVSTMIFSSLSDFLGSKKGMLIAFILLFAVATFLGGLVGSIGSLLLVRVIMGIAEGPVIPIIHSIVIAESTPSRRGFNMGLIQSSSNLFGSALAPVIAIALATTIGWRSTFYITALPALAMAFILMKYLRKPAAPKKQETQSSTEQEQLKPTRKQFFQMFRIRNIWLGMIMAISNILFILGLATFLPTILSDLSGFGEGKRSLLLGLLGLMFFVGQAFAPALSDRIGRRPTLIAFSFLSIFLPIAVWLYYDNFLVLLICIVLFALGNGYQPLIVAIIPAESVPRVLAASAIASCLLAAELIGGSAGPIVAGILADKYGLTTSLWVPITGAVIAFLCSFFIKETAPAIVNKKNNQAIAPSVST